MLTTRGLTAILEDFWVVSSKSMTPRSSWLVVLLRPMHELAWNTKAFSCNSVSSESKIANSKVVQYSRAFCCFSNSIISGNKDNGCTGMFVAALGSKIAAFSNLSRHWLIIISTSSTSAFLGWGWSEGIALSSFTVCVSSSSDSEFRVVSLESLVDDKHGQRDGFISEIVISTFSPSISNLNVSFSGAREVVQSKTRTPKT